MPDTQELEFTIEIKPKPVAGVSTKPVPEALAKHLTDMVPKVVKSDDHELTITAKTARDASELAAHAKRWGLSQEPKIYINKVPNGKIYPENVARLNVRYEADVPKENRPGRK